MINLRVSGPLAGIHTISEAVSELPGVVSPQGHSANLLRSVFKLFKLGRLCEQFSGLQKLLVPYL